MMTDKKQRKINEQNMNNSNFTAAKNKENAAEECEKDLHSDVDNHESSGMKADTDTVCDSSKGGKTYSEVGAESCDGSKDGVSETKTEAEAKVDEVNEKYIRLMADFQNQKKRFDKEKADIYQYANEDIVKNLLSVLDNFDRALEAAAGSDPKLLEGMELIFKQFWETLEKAGVSEIKALGEDFDPNFHNAVMMEDSSEHDSGKVSEVLQKGYILNGRVIRPSMVKVAN